VQAVDASQMAIVAGNVHPLARLQFDQGRVEPSMPMRVTMAFKMTTAQQADLDALLASQQDRGSPDYQRWLTPEQFGSRFGLSQGDINKVAGWLESQGFQVETMPASRNMIAFRGAAQQVESALHTEMHRYVVNGKTHFANSSNPSIPAALTNVVLGIRGLNNFQLKPQLVRKVNPKFTSGQTGNHFITPPDFATIYSVNQLYTQGFTGAGQTIAVVGQSDIQLSDVQAFRTNSSLPNPSKLPTIVHAFGEDPGMLSTDIDEANLDVDWAGAIAYNATVIFIIGDPNAAGGVFDALQYAITTSPIPAPVISTSYGACEADFATSDINSLQSLMQQANAEGITVLAPSGDSGAADCDNNPDANGNTVTVSTVGLAVDMPGSLANVTSVGGTEFQEGPDVNGQFWADQICIGLPTCGDLVNSARGYIPEGAWNDTNINMGGASTGLSASGGGASSVIPKPAWQAGTGVPNDGARDVPDISFSASFLQDPYLICSEIFNASANPQFTPSCVNGFRNSSGFLDAVGGTSVGPPAMAGIVALINQATSHTTGWGNINAILYPVAAHVPAAFHDITTGSNQVPFINACGAATPIGYNALTGYDLATGLGSINALALVTNWTNVTPASTAAASSSVDFSLAFSPAQMTVKRGACGGGNVQLTRLNGFVGTPTFTCNVSSSLGATTCAVVPVITGAFYPPGNYRDLDWWGIVGLVLAGVAFVVATFRRSGAMQPESRAWPRLVPGFALMALLAIIIGCGSNSNTSSSTSNLSVNYSFAVAVPSTAPVASGAISVNASIGSLSRTAQIVVTTQ
jgi:subtilase family serine protease